MSYGGPSVCNLGSRGLNGFVSKTLLPQALERLEHTIKRSGDLSICRGRVSGGRVLGWRVPTPHGRVNHAQLRDLPLRGRFLVLGMLRPQRVDE